MENSWTFHGLMAAFFDLAIVYFLLCCSTFAFFLSKFLALFGLNLPCLCNGFFGAKGPCLQNFLVHFPTHTISSVQLSVNSKFPFDSDPQFEVKDHVSLDSLATLGFVHNSPLLNFRGRTDPDTESNDGGKLGYENATSFGNPKKDTNHGNVDATNDENAVKILQQALEEEQVAREALFSELEQERLAAATAADEAMAMISRLQEEKSSIEIEARQFQRILEEKSAYDAEEMNILKDILFMTEREKHFLEKQVETYRNMFQAIGESRSYEKQEPYEKSSLDFDVDPMSIVQLSELIGNTRNVEKMSCFPEQTCTTSESKVSSIAQQSEDEAYQDIQEKGVLSINEVPYPRISESSYSQEHNNISLEQNTIVSENPNILDVHIIDPSSSSSKNYENPKAGLEINRSFSDVITCFPTENSSPRKSLVSELRRNSLSAVDNERLRIDSEVGWLRERLRTVQEEKEKLKSSLEIRERGKMELELLKDIANQLQDIRRLTAPEKASLPPLSSKAMLKKRRTRSASPGPGHTEPSLV